MRSKQYISRAGIEGVFLTFSSLPIIFFGDGAGAGRTDNWQVILMVISAVFFLCSGFTLLRRPLLGKFLGIGAVLTMYGMILPCLVTAPALALAASVTVVFIVSLLGKVTDASLKTLVNHAGYSLQRSWWGTLAAPMVVMISIVFSVSGSKFGVDGFAAASCIGQALFLQWSVAIRSWWRVALSLLSMVTVIFSVSQFSETFVICLVILLCPVFLLLMPHAPQKQGRLEKEEQWWSFLLTHPERILFTTFFLLSLAGSLFLSIPASTSLGSISFIDAVFTSVSAVCVTGLSVLDTSTDFTFFGQGIILVLIQLGGLGIMSITTVALHAMGRRLSLRHEKLLTSMTDTSHQDLLQSLGGILKFTFITEGIGALLLVAEFYRIGDSFVQALWRGVFTAVSAFCNAGFALQTNSLVPYQSQPLVLHTIAVLIIAGGLAPATSLMIPRWIRGKTVPIPAKIALVSTVVLLFCGTLCMLVFEWDGALAGFSFAEKCQNAWFQSVTLRTAGFNSVNLTNISNPTFLVFLFLMFIGGSPGGTAGGVKTTTVGVLAMTFWANITNQSQLVIQHRRIHNDTVYRAITIMIAGTAVCFLVVIMLEVTQPISSRSLIFEATSAVGTVGLSIGATAMLDGIGKVIVIIAMFLGRVGPISMFMLLRNEQAVSDTRYPVERISFT
ncbi:TrkH family potassium uptake protein [Desulfogranum japonicum]|uniref:TrkH family potassium uptake protein n=1 Tax=Desulfogranum japonicum TaxID=231447 RepID=UPI001969C731|nr:potassium transporter TrkG [Desulfogranum japonicum]